MSAGSSEIGVSLGEAEVVARYVGGSHVDDGTGVINGSAFDRTVKDIDGLSFTRRGVLALDEAADREEIRKAVGGRLKLGRTAVFAELPVGGILSALEEFRQPISLREDPLIADHLGPANPAHALLVGLPFAGEAIGSLKSEVAGDRLRQQIMDRFPAISSTDDTL